MTLLRYLITTTPLLIDDQILKLLSSNINEFYRIAEKVKFKSTYMVRVISIVLALSSIVTIPGVSQVKLPKPTGTYKVGTIVDLVVDETRKEKAVDNNTQRTLPIQIWYPCNEKDLPEKTAPYFKDIKKYVGLWGEERVKRLGSFKTNSFYDSNVAVEDGPYPVILFSHGWKSTRFLYTSILEELASHGYIVVGIDHPYMGSVLMPDGAITPSTEDHFSGPEEMLKYYADDLAVVLKYLNALNANGNFKGMIDLDNVGAMGHSNGFVPVMGALQMNEKIKTALLQDKFENGLEFLFLSEKPVMVIKTKGAEIPNDDFRKNLKGDFYFVDFDFDNHLSVSDISLIQEDSKQQQKNMMDIKAQTLLFFDAYLRAQDKSDLLNQYLLNSR